MQTFLQPLFLMHFRAVLGAFSFIKSHHKGMFFINTMKNAQFACFCLRILFQHFLAETFVWPSRKNNFRSISIDFAVIWLKIFTFGRLFLLFCRPFLLYLHKNGRNFRIQNNEKRIFRMFCQTKISLEFSRRQFFCVFGSEKSLLYKMCQLYSLQSSHFNGWLNKKGDCISPRNIKIQKGNVGVGLQ